MDMPVTDSPSTKLSDKDRSHLRWLAWSHYVAAVFFLIAGLIFLTTLVLGTLIVMGKMPQSSDPDLVAGSKILIAASAILWAGCWIPGALLIVLGWLLGHCKAYRLCMWLTAAQVIILFPIGPLLGAYAYKVANRPNVRAKFNAQNKHPD